MLRFLWVFSKGLFGFFQPLRVIVDPVLVDRIDDILNNKSSEKEETLRRVFNGVRNYVQEEITKSLNEFCNKVCLGRVTHNHVHYYDNGRLFKIVFLMFLPKQWKAGNFLIMLSSYIQGLEAFMVTMKSPIIWDRKRKQIWSYGCWVLTWKGFSKFTLLHLSLPMHWLICKEWYLSMW